MLGNRRELLFQENTETTLFRFFSRDWLDILCGF